MTPKTWNGYHLNDIELECYDPYTGHVLVGLWNSSHETNPK